MHLLMARQGLLSKMGEICLFFNASRNHWMAETRADNHKPGVYGYAAGSWQPKSGAINVLETGTHENTNNLQTLPFCFYCLLRLFLHLSVPSYRFYNRISSHSASPCEQEAEWDNWELED